MIEVDISHALGSFKLNVAFNAEAPVVALFGRSGAGKTSVVNSIAGMFTPNSGRIRINGETLFDRARGINLPPERRRIGYVFQDGLLFPHLSVEKNLFYGHRLTHVDHHYVDPKRVVELLGLRELLQRRPAHLSGGEKQRVAIGRALLVSPRLLLMDEPLASLDTTRKSEILQYVELLRDELHVPIVYVSHSLEEVSRVADTMVVLADGKSLAVGRVDDVMSRLDLRPHTGRFEALTIIETHVLEHDQRFELTRLGFDGGELWVPRVQALRGERVRVQVFARDVSVALSPPTGHSTLNVLSGEITALRDESGPIVELQIRVGTSFLLARITRRSIEQLGLQVGKSVYALLKSVSLNWRSVGFA